MKLLLLLLVVLTQVFGQTIIITKKKVAGGSGAFIASNGQGISTTSGTTVTFTTTRTISSGEHVVCGVTRRVGSGTALSSVSVGALSLAEDESNENGHYGVWLWSARASSGISSGATVTATFAGAIDAKAVGCFSLSGIASASYVRATSVGNGTATTGSSGATDSTPQSGDVAVGIIVKEETEVPNPSGSYSSINGQSEAVFGSNHATSYLALSGAGATTASWTWTPSRIYVAAVVVYKP